MALQRIQLDELDLADGLESPDREVTFVELNSLQGHDSFLVDMDNYRPLLAQFFE